MSTTHRSEDVKNFVHPDAQPPAQCLRHHVWMAACADCRAARPLPRQRAGSAR